MFKTKLSIATTALFALGLAACGSNAPTVDQVKEDFNSPSGSTKSKQSVAGAYSKQSNSNTAASFAAGGFAGGGFGLTEKRAGDVVRLTAINPFINYMKARTVGVRGFNLAEAQDASCFDPSSVSGSGDASGGSFSVTVDLGACGDGATGTLTMDGEIEVDETAGTFKFNVEATYDQVCTTDPAACIDGSMVMESESSLTGTASFFAGWFFTITEDGKTYETKGGIRLDADGGTGAASVEYLIYVKDENGQEVSLVLEATVDGQGNSTLKITGSDGSISCTANADGSGSCEGDLSWDAAFVEGLESDEEFASY